MKKLWQISGQLAFWLSWPLLWFYLRFSRRTRVLIINEDSVLLVHNWHSAGEWSLPGGGLHKNEDPKVGAVREALEETGTVLLPEQLKFLQEGKSSNRGLSYNYICFFIEVSERTETRGRVIEIVDMAWVPITELNPANTSKDTLQFLSSWQRR